MWYDWVTFCCVFLILQSSIVYCLPAGEMKSIPISGQSSENSVENEEEDGYQIVLRSPTQTLKVEVVGDDGAPTMRDIEVPSQEEVERVTEVFEEPLSVKSRKSRVERRQLEKEYKCNWRRLYKLYLSKRQRLGRRRVKYSRGKQMEIRDAFKTICDNPEESITYLLNLDE